MTSPVTLILVTENLELFRHQVFHPCHSRIFSLRLYLATSTHLLNLNAFFHSSFQNWIANVQLHYRIISIFQLISSEFTKLFHSIICPFIGSMSSSRPPPESLRDPLLATKATNNNRNNDRKGDFRQERTNIQHRPMSAKKRSIYNQVRNRKEVLMCSMNVM